MRIKRENRYSATCTVQAHGNQSVKVSEWLMLLLSCSSDPLVPDTESKRNTPRPRPLRYKVHLVGAQKSLRVLERHPEHTLPTSFLWPEIYISQHTGNIHFPFYNKFSADVGYTGGSMGDKAEGQPGL